MRDRTADPDNKRSASFRGEHAENSGTTADVQHGFSLEEMGIVHDRGSV